MGCHLRRIEPDIHQYASIIAQILDIDVNIVDEEFNTVAATGLHQDCFAPNIGKHAFLYREALQSGQGVKLDFDPKDNPVCAGCPKKDDCRQTFQISAPIRLEDRLIGMMCLLGVTEEQKARCLQNSEVIAGFLRQTSELISSKASLACEYDKQNNLVEMLNYINEKIDEGVLVISDAGQIVSINPKGRKILDLGENCRLGPVLLKATGEKILHYDEYSLSIGDTEFCVAGTAFDMNIRHWEKLLIFRDRHFFNQEVSRSVFKNDALGLENIEGESPQIKALKENVLMLSASFSNVLILGESGTGKELFARALHETSKRAEHPFVALNCAAIPESLLESELFGYVKGAFTGADPGGKIGKFELADNGTIFLDEIGDMPLFIQAKLLRVLECREIVRLGSSRPKKIDVRIVAATHKNLKQLVKEGMFREDLYYRLNVIPMEIPPLRERKGDITLLADIFLKRYANKLGKTILAVDPGFYANLESHAWPGNVRELQNVVEYSVNMMETGGKPSICLLKKRLGKNETRELGPEDFNLKKIERDTIEKALLKYKPLGYSREEIAQKLGIGPATLYRKLNEYGVNG